MSGSGDSVRPNARQAALNIRDEEQSMVKFSKAFRSFFHREIICSTGGSSSIINVALLSHGRRTPFSVSFPFLSAVCCPSKPPTPRGEVGGTTFRSRRKRRDTLRQVVDSSKILQRKPTGKLWSETIAEIRSDRHDRGRDLGYILDRRGVQQIQSSKIPRTRSTRFGRDGDS